MKSILKEITDRIRADQKADFDSYDPRITPVVNREPPADVMDILNNNFFVIAEVKRSSPSAGDIREDFDPLNLARAYRRGGASAISVLTEKNYFRGNINDLKVIKDNLPLPVLRKDFIIHPWQVYQSYNLGADMILLISACLSQQQLKILYEISLSLGMIPLVEVHNREELKTALSTGAEIIGINNRDLNTFRVDLDTSFRLKEMIPPEIKVISESGISRPAHIRRLKDSGFSGVLIGEALLRQNDPENKLKELVNG